jgi:triacylglycerol lipase
MLLILMFIAISVGLAEQPRKGEIVFLIHGLGRSSASMFLLKHRLENQGFELISKSYDSRGGGIEDHVEWLAEEIHLCCEDEDRPLHFVTHSLGGIVLRAYLKDVSPPDLGRVVMLTPPSQGSELAEYLKDWEVYRIAMGPSGQEIGIGAESYPNVLGPVEFELGVIAGDRSINPLTSQVIPGPNDGKVSVESARVEGMRDFIVLEHSHTFIMNSPEVAEQIVSFLRTGAFFRDEEIPDSTNGEE